MPQEIYLPMSMALGLIAFSCIARWYAMPSLRGRSRTDALVPLLLLHCFRFIGLAFLVPGVTSVPLDPRFSHHAAYGDLVAAFLALLGVVALRGGWRLAVPVVWVFNLVGLLDLINAVSRGVRYVPAGEFGATYFIPAIIVPALLVTHVVIFVLLLRKDGDTSG